MTPHTAHRHTAPPRFIRKGKCSTAFACHNKQARPKHGTVAVGLVIRCHHPRVSGTTTLSRAMLALGACVLVAGFTGPYASRVVPRSGLTHVRMADETPASPAQPKPSCVIDAEGTDPVSKQFAADCASMGSMGAYMSIRSYMAQAFNAADADADGFVTKDQLGSVLAALREDASPSAVAAQFSAADVTSSGKVTYEQWCKARAAHRPASFPYGAAIAHAAAPFLHSA